MNKKTSVIAVARRDAFMVSFPSPEPLLNAGAHSRFSPGEHKFETFQFCEPQKLSTIAQTLSSKIRSKIRSIKIKSKIRRQNQEQQNQEEDESRPSEMTALRSRRNETRCEMLANSDCIYVALFSPGAGGGFGDPGRSSRVPDLQFSLQNHLLRALLEAIDSFQ